MSDSQLDLKVQIGQVFRPGTPIDQKQLFAGRLSQVNDVLNAALQPGRHVVMFGERGVGKTSLAKYITGILSASGHTSLDCNTINCDSTDDFSTLWRKVFREISFSQTTKQQAGFSNIDAARPVALDTLLPDRSLQPDDIRYILTKLNTPSLIVIDEVDKLSPVSNARSLLADTIKTLSDHPEVRTTIILIGVADSVDELIAEHQSIDRALVQVPMQRMSSEELIQIIHTGLTTAGMTAEPGVPGWIAKLSQGLPHYTHSLGLYAAFAAIEDGRNEITPTDVLVATKATVDKSHTLRSTYNKATSSPQKQNLYAQVLGACALTSTDELGYFRASGLAPIMSNLMGRRYIVPNFSRHLYDFCEAKRGPVLKKVGEPRSIRFRFIDPMMQPFVIIHDYSIGELTNKLLQESQGRIGANEKAQDGDGDGI